MIDSHEPPASSPIPLHALGLLAYLNILFLVPFFASPKRSFERFHAEQGAALFVTWLLGMGVSAAFPAGIEWMAYDFVNIATAVLMAAGTRNIILGVREGLPVLERVVAALEAHLAGTIPVPPSDPGAGGAGPSAE